MKFEQLKAGSPYWMSDEAILTLKRGYLQKDETPFEMYDRLAKTAASYYPNGISIWTQAELHTAFLEAFCKGWLSPASPVASNFGAKDGLPISCFGLKAANSINGILLTMHEAGMLSKNGGGLGIDISSLLGPSKLTTWAKGYDWLSASVSQGGVRRGAVALYADINHPSIRAFLDAKDLLQGDPREKLDCNIAVILDKKFMARLHNKEEEALELFARILELRMKYGSPYIMFKHHAQNADPDCYKANNLATEHSQLCSEIFLHSDESHTYTCCLSSLNLDKYYAWKYHQFARGLTLPMLAIFFLDAVNQEFINKSEHINGMANARRSAIKGRALGLGTLGLHSLYMSKGLPFESPEARQLNIEVHQLVQEHAKHASRLLAELLGEPEWCKGFGLRNTHLIAIAPTTTNSVLCNAGSPGIEPISANYYAMAGAKGTFVRKNKYLEPIVEARFDNPGMVWAEIRKANGSIKAIKGFTEHEKLVFKTAFEIDQAELVRQAADRQQFVCQGQSLNLFFYEDASAEHIINIHLLADKLGLKSLYYIRSMSKMQTASAIAQAQYVFMRTRPDCPYCQKAKDLLDGLSMQYDTEFKPDGKVPEIWLDGELLQDGYTSLVQIMQQKGNVLIADSNLADSTICGSCEG